MLDLYLHGLMTVQRTVGTVTEIERDGGDRGAGVSQVAKLFSIFVAYFSYFNH